MISNQSTVGHSRENVRKMHASQANTKAQMIFHSLFAAAAALNARSTLSLGSVDTP